MISIVHVDPRHIEVALSVKIDWPAVAFVGLDDGEFVGSGGLAWGAGRCWLWFQMSKANPRYIYKVLSQAKVLLRKAGQLGEAEVWTVRDESFPQSVKLLKKLGFEFNEMKDGQEVYVCHSCP